MKTIRRSSDKGFALIEIILVLLIFSLLLPVGYNFNTQTEESIENMIITSQIKALATRSVVMVDHSICPMGDCWFNAKGNINRAKTLVVDKGGQNVELVFWLGFGRFRIKQRIFTH